MQFLIGPALLNKAPSGGGFVGIVQTKLLHLSGATDTTWSITPDTPFTHNNIVVVPFGYYRDGGNADVASMKCNGVAMARAVLVQTDDGGTHVFESDIWLGYAGNTIANGGSGPDGILATLTASAPVYVNARAIERDDAVVSSPLGPTNTATGNGTAPAVGLTPTQPKMFIVSAMCGENNATDTISTPGSPWIQAYVNSDGSSEVPCAGTYETVNSTSPLTATYGYAAAHDWVACIAAIKLQ